MAHKLEYTSEKSVMVTTNGVNSVVITLYSFNNDSTWTQLDTDTLPSVNTVIGAGVDCIAATTEDVEIHLGGSVPCQVLEGSIIDGITLAIGDIVLVKDQTITYENGLYVVQAAAQAPIRHTDYDTVAEILQYTVTTVTSGTTNENTYWVMSGSTPTQMTDPIVFTRSGSTSTYSYSEDGVYYYKVVENGTTYAYVDISFYDIRVVLNTEAQNNLCGCNTPNCDFNPTRHYDFVMLSLLSMAYFGLSRYVVNVAVTDITDSVIVADLLTILENIERSIRYMDNMGE